MIRSARWKTAVCAAVLFLVNAWVARELFTADYIDQMGSIESAYIALARYISANWGGLTWFPLWYNGIPFQNTYPPVLHLLVAAVAQVLQLSPALSYHAVTATFYCLGPVTLFWLALRLSGSRIHSVAAALLYSVFSPSLLLLPAARADAGGIWAARRFQALVQWGEGPHVASMTLLPLAIVLLDIAYERRRPGYYLLAALSMAAVVLTNWLGGAALGAAVLAWLLSRSFPSTRRVWLTALAIGVFAYAVVCPWIPPSTLAAIRMNAQRIGGEYRVTMLHLRYAGLLLAALAVFGFWFERSKLGPCLRFAVVFASLMAALALSAAWFGVSILPQPDRYHLEMEMGIALAVVFAARPLLDRMRRHQKALVAAGLVLFSWSQLKTYRGFAKWMDRPIDIRRTVEYKAAGWFGENTPQDRVFTPGSVGFWLNAFVDTPQLGGGFDQGLTNPLLPVAIYQLYSGEGAAGREGEIGEAWLKVFGVQAVFMPGLRGNEAYKPVRNPWKFRGRFKEVWREGDDAIYEVPQRTKSLAHVVNSGDVVARPPAGGLDIAPLQPYLAALDNPSLPPAEFRWMSRSRARIAAELRPDQLLSVQTSFHTGWHATVNGEARRTRRDGLGLLVIEPKCAGGCTVELEYNGGAEMLAARILSWSALLGALVWIGVDFRRRRS